KRMSLNQWESFVDEHQGEKIGSGRSRSVYLLPDYPDLVLKVDNGSTRLQNVLEWVTWKNLGDTRQGVWLAPCEAISPRGIYMLQRRADPWNGDDDYLRDFLPDWIQDKKAKNFGVIDGRLVAVDYGMTRILQYGKNTIRGLDK